MDHLASRREKQQLAKEVRAAGRAATARELHELEAWGQDRLLGVMSHTEMRELVKRLRDRQRDRNTARKAA